MRVLGVYALQRLTSAYDMAVPFKLQGHGEILKMQPFQRLIHNSGLSDLPPVSSLSMRAVLFKINGTQGFKVQVRQWNRLSVIGVIHKYTKIALSVVCLGGYTACQPAVVN